MVLAAMLEASVERKTCRETREERLKHWDEAYHRVGVEVNGVLMLEVSPILTPALHHRSFSDGLLGRRRTRPRNGLDDPAATTHQETAATARLAPGAYLEAAPFTLQSQSLPVVYTAISETGSKVKVRCP